jgi:hypothetical protein
MTRIQLQEFARMVEDQSYVKVAEMYDKTLELCKRSDGAVAAPSFVQQFVQIWRDLRRRQNPPSR